MILHKFYLLIALLVVSVSMHAQEKMILENQTSISATPIWQFSSATYKYSGIVDVQIGNNGQGGTLMIQVKTSDTTFFIGGTAYLFLGDGNVITCTDKKRRAIRGETIQAFYVLTPAEIKLLKKNKITDVRFRINGTDNPFSSPTGFFTASNKIRSFGLADKTYDTVAEINLLFK